MADEAAVPEAVAAGGSNKKMLGIVGLVALLFGGGGGYAAATMLGGGGGGDEDLIAEQGDTEADQPIAAKATRTVVPMDDFTINLRGTGGGRVLRLEVAAEVDEADAAVVSDKMAALRDAVLTLASDYTYNDLEGIDGKMRLRDELLARLNTSLENEAKVKRVYFTQFVVQ